MSDEEAIEIIDKVVKDHWAFLMNTSVLAHDELVVEFAKVENAWQAVRELAEVAIINIRLRGDE